MGGVLTRGLRRKVANDEVEMFSQMTLAKAKSQPALRSPKRRKSLDSISSSRLRRRQSLPAKLKPQDNTDPCEGAVPPPLPRTARPPPRTVDVEADKGLPPVNRDGNSDRSHRLSSVGAHHPLSHVTQTDSLVWEGNSRSVSIGGSHFDDQDPLAASGNSNHVGTATTRGSGVQKGSVITAKTTRQTECSSARKTRSTITPGRESERLSVTSRKTDARDKIEEWMQLVPEPALVEWNTPIDMVVWPERSDGTSKQRSRSEAQRLTNMNPLESLSLRRSRLGEERGC